MKTFLKKAGLGVALGATAIGLTAAPAQAQRWHRYHHYHHHHGDSTGAALLGGLVGLGIGAAIASDNNDYYDRGYYAPPPPPPTVYEYRYDYRPRCWTQWRWDPYWGRNVRVRVCD